MQKGEGKTERLEANKETREGDEKPGRETSLSEGHAPKRSVHLFLLNQSGVDKPEGKAENKDHLNGKGCTW